MKKNFIYGLMSAIALTSAMGFTACSDDTSLVNNNPRYNPATGEVTTDFVFNVSRAISSTTRMTAEDTQATLQQKFRGIDNAYLMSVKLGTANDGHWVANKSSIPAPVTTGEGDAAVTTYSSKLFNMGQIMNAEYINPTMEEGETNTNKSHRIIEISLPAETNTLLFWGKAIKKKSDPEQGFTQMTIPMDMDLDKVEFKLKRVVPNDEDEPSNPMRHATLEQYQNMIAALLTHIIRTKATWTEGTGDAQVQKSLAWVDYVTEITEEGGSTVLHPETKDPGCEETGDDRHDMFALGEVLAEAYCSFNTIYPNELRAGSGDAILRMIGDLYIVINKVATASPTGPEEKAAYEVAKAIKTNIQKFFNSDATAWKDPSDLITAVKNNCGMSDTDLNLIQTDDDTYAMNNFPSFFNLPKGAVILENDYEKYTTDTTDPSYNSTNAGKPIMENNKKKYYYKYMGTVPTYAMGGSSTSGSTENNSNFDPRNYMFPPELCYFGNSPIRVTDDTHSAEEYPNGAGNGSQEWMNEASWAAGATGTGSKAWTKGGHVLSTTRSVAMQHNINYGTAMLQTQIKYGVGTLEDNNAAIQLSRKGATEANNTIKVNGSPKFALTGVLIGGQNPIMGWNYIAKPNVGSYGAMVYDKVPSVNIPSTASDAETSEGSYTAPNYTLVWDNYEVGQANQRVVYLALEFVNNSDEDFWGEHNLIRKGGTFYLTAKLDPDAMPSGYSLPSGVTLESGKTNADYYKEHKSEGIEWPQVGTVTEYALPPYNADGSTIQERRVFIQDHKTIATLKFNKTSLQHALVEVPDLRSAQLSLGLSVDMEWRSGLTFDDVILGQ